MDDILINIDTQLLNRTCTKQQHNSDVSVKFGKILNGGGAFKGANSPSYPGDLLIKVQQMMKAPSIKNC